VVRTFLKVFLFLQEQIKDIIIIIIALVAVVDLLASPTCQPVHRAADVSARRRPEARSAWKI
jgi:hypothetical protein